MVWVIFCYMLPDKDGKRVTRMHGKTFDTYEEAIVEYTALRYQNLPFDMKVEQINNPFA
jgi:hypothetical protein